MAATAADAPLLATKLFVPPPRPNRVDRARLRDQLDAARGGTVTLAAAPAGSGKSTLLADWALSAKTRVAWLSLDDGDDEPARFLNSIIAALRNAGVAAIAPFTGVTSANPAEIDAALTEVMNALAGFEAAAALVLDDYHAIESESVHRIVQRIVDHIPQNLHLVIATRVDPPLALSRLRARGMLLEIRARDLRFTPEEVARFFNDAMGLGLTGDQIGELEARTEGWAVGLQMAAISLRGSGEATRFISSFSGSNRHVLDYLTDEVLHRQSDDVRSFLLETSILSQLAAPLCDAVTGRTDSARILRFLDAANLFLIPLDNVRFWYRYHHLFGSLLQHEMERSTSADRRVEMHRRASLWYESNGMPEPALLHAISAGDDDRAAAIVSEHARRHIMTGDGGTVVRWISHLPRERVETDAGLLLLHGRALTNLYELDRARSEIDRAEAILSGDDRQKYAGAILSFRGMLEGLTGNVQRSIEMLERAMPLFDPADFWYSMTSLHLGIAALMAPDLRKAEVHLAHATFSRDQSDGLLTAVVGNCFGGLSRLWRGEPDEAMRMATEAEQWIDDWEKEHHTGRPLSSLSHVVFADIERAWNNLDRARSLAERALEFGRNGFLIGYFEAATALAQVADAQGDWDVAIDAANEMLRGCQRSGSHSFLGAIEALKHHIIWRRGLLTGNDADVASVVRWCDELQLTDAGRWRERLTPGLYTDYALMLGARVLLHQERHAEAEELIGNLFDEALRRERVPAQITLLILRARAERNLGRGDAGVDTMRRALEIAAKPRFVRSFLNEGSAILPLIERAAPQVTNRDFALRVLGAFEVPVKLRPAPAGAAEPLSEREIEVLRLIASGASNQAAARKLFVAPSTVKKHLENIYAKLGVGGRTQAVARARELHIL
jgi:ATP/maltotriose-dependent transcriptional regulator MalT